MTDKQKSQILGIVCIHAMMVSAFVFGLSLFVADNFEQCVVYAGLSFIVAFAIDRWRFFRMARKIADHR